jgi:predicted PurR-regulated permease PerM
MELSGQLIKKIIGIITFTVLLFVGVQNFPTVWASLLFVMGLFTPILLGLSLAFVLNVLMDGIEKLMVFLFKRNKGKVLSFGLKRGIALLLTLFIVIGLIFVLYFLVVPEFKRTLELVITYLPDFANKVDTWSQGLVKSLPFKIVALPKVELDWAAIQKQISQFMGNGGYAIFSTTIGLTASILGGLLNFILGIVFAIYILLQKEVLGAQFKKLFQVYLSPEHFQRFLKVSTLSGAIFSKFVTGQFFEAALIGALCFIGMSIFGMPYATVISSLIAVTALIPIFGALIGTAFGAFLILMVNPAQALWFILFIVILQQLEGNLIYPKVVGNSIGLPGIWVLAAVTLGGSAFGIPGMLIGVPMTSVVYSLLRETVYARLKEQNNLDER